MSTPTPTNPIFPAKPKSKKSKEKDKDKASKENAQLPGERLKIVIRRLPPNLPEDTFWQSVSSWVTDETTTWKSYYPGKPRKRVNKENIPSRAYIGFKNPEQMLTFGREYDGHKFVDKSGNEYYAVVEFAPYQKVPGEKKKPDSRHATIEKDEDYISFIESLNDPSKTEPVSIETLIASTRPPSPPKTTPLLEALKAEKQAQKDKEAIIRNHSHYKDLMSATSPSALRKEEKRKARAEAASASAGKKGKKASAPPAPSKQIQIQAKPNTSGGSAHNTNAPAAKPQAMPGRPGRGGKHAPKVGKDTVPAPSNGAAPPASAPKDVQPPPVNAPNLAIPAQASAQETPAGPPPSARRGRPVLGLGSRHFEAALNGAGVTGERKKKGREPAMVLSTPIAQAQVTQEKPISSTSPKRPRHRKVPGGTGIAPDANDASVLSVPVASQAEGGGTLPNFNVGRGGRRGGRGGGGGRGRGGPPRVA